MASASADEIAHWAVIPRSAITAWHAGATAHTPTLRSHPEYGERRAADPAWKNTPAKCAVVIVVTWLIVGIPLAYGVFNAVKAALQLFG